MNSGIFLEAVGKPLLPRSQVLNRSARSEKVTSFILQSVNILGRRRRFCIYYNNKIGKYKLDLLRSRMCCYRLSIGRRTFGLSNVHSWLASTPRLTKSIWTMAVAQHQFHLDQRKSEVSGSAGEQVGVWVGRLLCRRLGGCVDG